MCFVTANMGSDQILKYFDFRFDLIFKSSLENLAKVFAWLGPVLKVEKSEIWGTLKLSLLVWECTFQSFLKIESVTTDLKSMRIFFGKDVQQPNITLPHQKFSQPLDWTRRGAGSNFGFLTRHRSFLSRILKVGASSLVVVTLFWYNTLFQNFQHMLLRYVVTFLFLDANNCKIGFFLQNFGVSRLKIEM